jgi:hypothetical protein
MPEIGRPEDMPWFIVEFALNEVKLYKNNKYQYNKIIY